MANERSIEDIEKEVEAWMRRVVEPERNKPFIAPRAVVFEGTFEEVASKVDQFIENNK